jgi:hypothetical protein
MYENSKMKLLNKYHLLDEYKIIVNDIYLFCKTYITIKIEINYILISYYE